MKALRSVLRGSLGPGHFIFALVFLVRLLALTRLAGSQFLLPNDGDMFFYDNWAQRILHGQFTDHLAFYGLPLYAYILAGLYKVFGYGPFIPGLIQAALDAGTAVLIYRIAGRIFTTQNDDPLTRRAPKIIGALSALGWAFFVPAQAYSIILMPTAWLVFVFWFIVWEIVKRDRPPSLTGCLLYGVLIGVTATGVATILFIVPLLLAALFKRSPQSQTQPRWLGLVASIALLFFGIGIGTAPCWIHNRFVAHDPVFLSAHSGINFWLGNNPEATGYPHFPGLHAGQAAMLQDSIDLAEAAAGRPLLRSEVAAYWSQKARSYMEANFFQWTRLVLKKMGNLANAFEYDDLSIIFRLRAQGIIMPGPHFGLIAALALPGFFFSVLAFPRSRWIAAAVLLHLVSILPVFVTERYRLAAVPGLLLFAAYGLWRLWESILQRRSRDIVTYTALVAVAVAVVSMPRSDPSLWALTAYNVGRQALDSNDLPLANKELALAYAYAPQSSETNFALGNLRVAEGDPVAAKNFYAATLRFDPVHKGALNNLGILALNAEDWNRAADLFREALKVAPNDAKTHYLLAQVELNRGNTEIAHQEIEAALQKQPDQPEFIKLREAISQRQ